MRGQYYKHWKRIQKVIQKISRKMERQFFDYVTDTKVQKI